MPTTKNKKSPTIQNIGNRIVTVVQNKTKETRFTQWKHRIDRRIGYAISFSLFTIATILFIYGLFHIKPYHVLTEYINKTLTLVKYEETHFAKYHAANFKNRNIRDVTPTVDAETFSSQTIARVEEVLAQDETTITTTEKEQETTTTIEEVEETTTTTVEVETTTTPTTTTTPETTTREVIFVVPIETTTNQVIVTEETTIIAREEVIVPIVITTKSTTTTTEIPIPPTIERIGDDHNRYQLSSVELIDDRENLESFHTTTWTLFIINLILFLFLLPITILYTRSLTSTDDDHRRTRRYATMIIYRTIVVLSLLFLVIQFFYLFSLFIGAFQHQNLIDKLFVDGDPQWADYVAVVEQQFSCSFNPNPTLVELNMQDVCLPKIKNALFPAYIVFMMLLLDVFPICYAVFIYFFNQRCEQMWCCRWFNQRRSGSSTRRPKPVLKSIPQNQNGKFINGEHSHEMTETNGSTSKTAPSSSSKQRAADDEDARSDDSLGVHNTP